ncbi:GNAT family N-acetyltransferase [Tardiphaga alba]|nr:GNAT family N-acetyltransferase [Tardiphaga alba]
MTTPTTILRLAIRNDAADLQSYFGSLSKAARYNRFLGHAATPTLDDINRIIGCDGDNFFCVVATQRYGLAQQIIGEAVCSIAPSAEIALSVDDSVQGCGLGRALLMSLESLAAQRAACELHGTILSSNDRIAVLARSLGYTLERPEGDWTHRVIRKALPVSAVIPFRSSPAMAASPWPYLKGALRAAAGRA